MNAVGELVELADAIAIEGGALSALEPPFKKLKAAAKHVGRAWCGSNIGYHARIYFEGLQPVPANVLFSPEWGLINSWPSHEPDRRWSIFDEQEVRNAIVALADGIDPVSLKDQHLTPLRRAFGAHRENLISILSAILAANHDAFLEKRLHEIEELDALLPDVIAHRMLPGRYFTRDSEALSMGLRVAPHQSILALSYSAEMLEAGLRRLDHLARLAAAHIQRLNPEGSRGVQTGGKITFIGHGHSPAWLELRIFLKDALGLAVSEFNAVSAAGIPTVNRLQDMLSTAAFAFIVMTGEDELRDGQKQARQNVVQELGLFQGRLGFGKAIALLEDGCTDFSNIHGLGVIKFQKDKIAGCFEEIRHVLEREGIIGTK
jgi:predicted nucleotide-binding protein